MTQTTTNIQKTSKARIKQKLIQAISEKLPEWDALKESNTQTQRLYKIASFLSDWLFLHGEPEYEDLMRDFDDLASLFSFLDRRQETRGEHQTYFFSQTRLFLRGELQDRILYEFGRDIYEMVKTML